MATEEPDGKVIPLGERLREHRTARGLSQAQAARELDVARTAYRLWELEAAKPSPDRWRLIAGWLGISISALLLGEELIGEEDAAEAHQIADRGAPTWDERSGAGSADFFDQGAFRKRFTADVHAPELARTALLVTAAGLPDEVVEHAELLISELVTNSVERSEGGSLWAAVTLRPRMLRVEVGDSGDGDRAGSAPKRPLGERARWSLAITAELASRFGAGREQGLNVAWFEIDIPAGEPGTGD